MFEVCEIMGGLYLVKKQPTSGQIQIVAQFNGAPNTIRTAAQDIAASLNAGLGVSTFAPAIGPS